MTRLSSHSRHVACRQNWVTEYARLEAMVGSLRQRMQASIGRVAEDSAPNPPSEAQVTHSSLQRTPSLDIVEALERQLDDIRDAMEGVTP